MIEVEVDPLERYLQNWVTFMHSPGLNLNINIGGIYGGATNTDFDTLCESLDLRLAEATGAIIDHELNPAQRCSIHHRYLHAVYTFPRGNYPQVLADAREIIRMALYNKGIFVE